MKEKSLLIVCFAGVRKEIGKRELRPVSQFAASLVTATVSSSASLPNLGFR